MSALIPIPEYATMRRVRLGRIEAIVVRTHPNIVNRNIPAIGAQAR